MPGAPIMHRMLASPTPGLCRPFNLPPEHGVMVETAGFVVTGHRGAMALESENTMASFELARELGADEIEFDVWLTADGVAVVHHDEQLGRVVNGTGAVREHSWEQLSRLRVHRRHAIPSLDEVLALTGIGFQLELKDPAAASGVAAVVAADPRLRRSVLTTSFVASALEPALEASLRTGLICGPGDAHALGFALALGVDQVLAHWSVASHRDALRFSDAGGTLTVWPTPDAATAARAMRVGFGGTTCDDPSVALDVRGSLVA
jgi:glycerophosphoryl diester phosphodiesterase